MKLCRLIEWFKGLGRVSAADYAALLDKVYELEGVIYDLSQEIDRKELVILWMEVELRYRDEEIEQKKRRLGRTIQRAEKAELVVKRLLSQRDNLRQRASNLESDWPAIHKKYFIVTSKRSKA